MTVDDVMVDDGRFVAICCVGARDWIDVEQRHKLDVTSMAFWCKFDATASVDVGIDWFVRDAMADDEIGYGTDWARTWPAIDGFCTFGVHTAQGSSPTKRSPHGLASGCVWELIFNYLQSTAVNRASRMLFIQANRRKSVGLFRSNSIFVFRRLLFHVHNNSQWNRHKRNRTANTLGRSKWSKVFGFECIHFEILPVAPLLCSWIQSRADRRCFPFFLTLASDERITLFIFKISVRRLFESKYSYLFENRHFYDFPRTIHKFEWRLYRTQALRTREKIRKWSFVYIFSNFTYWHESISFSLFIRIARISLENQLFSVVDRCSSV